MSELVATMYCIVFSFLELVCYDTLPYPYTQASFSNCTVLFSFYLGLPTHSNGLTRKLAISNGTVNVVDQINRRKTGH